jgi:hypothetical protein
MAAAVDRGQLPDWTVSLLVVDAATDRACLVDALTRLAVYREAWEIRPETPLVGHEPGSSDPLRLSAYADALRAAQPHLAVTRASAADLELVVERSDRALRSAPPTQTDQLAAAHGELRAARLGADPDRAAAAAAVVEQVEAAATLRRDWWAATEITIVRADHARRELARRGVASSPRRAASRTVTR